ncbi:MAG TPA: thioredoxin family protein [Candidatus Paraprevotella stercorigallinarum]|jgi:thiol:disulfide interchange protein|nr:thioredoxin family protein [Candidatus Paraprevotella stercorigallinarum]
MKKIISSLFLLLLCFTASAQMQEPVKFSVTQKTLSDTEFEIVFTGKVEAGWHVYSTDIPDGGPTPAAIIFDQIKGVEPVGKLKPAGKVVKQFDNLFEMEVSYMEGQATFIQKMRITGADYSVKGILTYGACNDENCIPPSEVGFSFSGKGKAGSAAEDKDMKEQEEVEEVAAVSDTLKADSVVATAVADSVPASVAGSDYWAPVIDELAAYGESASNAVSQAWWKIFLLGFLGGLVALLTPCVWPIIPMTVSFFLKRSGDKKKGIRDAFTYGISIVVIYVLLGLVITGIFGASALNALSTNAIFNIFFCLMLLVFAASFFGAFELTLPSSWSNAVDSKAESTTGFLSIFLMAFTLALVSFSCTGPIIGFLLVEVSTSGSVLAPTIGMLGFAIALALPFSLFALFPTWLKQMPKSGNWMNCVKVCLGFVELAFALKFLSVADLAYGWHILDRETFLALWIAIFGLLGLYLLGKIRFPHDEDEDGRISVSRFFLALLSIAFAIYMIPGLWGAPLKAISAFSPPMKTQDFNLYDNEVKAQFMDYDAGMAYARQHNKPVMIDFTGYGCVNCRKMELAVWVDQKVADIMNNDYVLITLYVDDKTPLAEKITVVENGQERTLRTIGDKWSYLQRVKFGANAQPFYVLLDNEGKPLNKSYSYDEDVSKYIDFLQTGLKNYKK